MCSSFDTFENYIHITISFNTLALFLRQERESAERTHEEQMASTKQSAQERERDLAALLEQTEAKQQRRGQCLHPQQWHHALS